jgi:glycosyltransferase involved in cell wall biosynthesis
MAERKRTDLERIVFLFSFPSNGGTQRVAKTLVKNTRGLSISIVYLSEFRKGSSSIWPKNTFFNFIDFLNSGVLTPNTKVVCFNIELSILALLFRRRAQFVTRVMNTLSYRVKDHSLSIKARLFTYLYIKTLHFNDLIVFQSECMLNDYLKNTGRKEILKKSRVIFNPVEINDFTTCYSNNKSYRFVWAGRLVDQKNILYLKHIIPFLENKKIDYMIDIFGDGPLDKFILDSFQEPIERGAINLKGYSSSIQWATYDCCILFSKYEGMPNVLLDALSHGLPVVSTILDCGPEEIVIQGVNGYLASSPEEFAECMLLCRSINRDLIGSTLAKFEVDYVIDMWEELLC